MHTGVCNLYFQTIIKSVRFENLDNQTDVVLEYLFVFANLPFQSFANCIKYQLTFISIKNIALSYNDLYTILCMFFIS